jgi:hypothetical protein
VAFAAGPALFFLHAMSKARDILGAITGILLILSSGALYFTGWGSMRSQLVDAGAPDDVVARTSIGLLLATIAILLCGCVLFGVFITRLRGLVAPLWPARLIGIAYTIAGLVAYKMSDNNFFMTLFVVPGILIALASWGSDADSDV